MIKKIDSAHVQASAAAVDKAVNELMQRLRHIANANGGKIRFKQGPSRSMKADVNPTDLTPISIEEVRECNRRTLETLTSLSGLGLANRPAEKKPDVQLPQPAPGKIG